MPKTIEEYNRDLFINAVYNNDEIEISDDLATELVYLYDVRQAHMAQVKREREEYYKGLALRSLGQA